MISAAKNNKYFFFRKEFSYFIFKKFDLDVAKGGLKVIYDFDLAGRYRFRPTLFIPKKTFLDFDVEEQVLNNLAFHIGMIEMISYWKAACPPEVVVEAGPLNSVQAKWWKGIYFHGLGEFFYRNGIRAGVDDFMNLKANDQRPFDTFAFNPSGKYLVPVGGGKDSVVTLEMLLRSGEKVIPFVLNPRKAAVDTIINAGLPEESMLSVKRTLDPALLELNDKGFLNGHTPFSALLAFVSLLAARLAGAGNIALSNESSANEATVPGTDVNHQYSKSFAFEKDFRDYVSGYISPDLNYFSLLRPLSELQIARIFSKYPAHFKDFRSCNVGSKTNSWCGKCPKCLFTWIILSPFVSQEQLTGIFGKNLFSDGDLDSIFRELTGMSEVKPFECVGTVDEVNTALVMTIDRLEKPLPLLLEQYRTSQLYERYRDRIPSEMPGTIDAGNFVPDHLLERIKKALK